MAIFMTSLPPPFASWYRRMPPLSSMTLPSHYNVGSIILSSLKKIRYLLLPSSFRSNITTRSCF